jgi:predicted DNA-binding transcriptional regulator AlpA
MWEGKCGFVQSGDMMQSSNNHEPFVDSEQAGKFLSFHPKTVERWARQGVLPAHPAGIGKRKFWRFLISELDEWMKSNVISARYPCRN